MTTTPKYSLSRMYSPPNKKYKNLREKNNKKFKYFKKSTKSPISLTTKPLKKNSHKPKFKKNIKPPK